MTHDPLCPTARNIWLTVSDVSRVSLFAWQRSSEQCHCRLIAKVRADERERCIHILSSFTARFIEDARGGAA